MSATCSICRRADREAIETAHIEGGSLRVIAKAHPGTTIWSLRRHFQHLPAIIEKTSAHELAQHRASGKLPARVEELITHARNILVAATAKKSWLAAVAALREYRHCLELIGRLSGELGGTQQGEFVPGVAAAQSNTVTVNLAPTEVDLAESRKTKDPRELFRLLEEVYGLARSKGQNPPVM